MSVQCCGEHICVVSRFYMGADTTTKGTRCMSEREASAMKTTVEWFGVNALRFTHEGRTVLVDPYVTRDPDATSDPDILARHFPAADYILISHSHWDHIADTPALAKITGATVVGSETTINVCRAHGIAEKQLHLIEPGGFFHCPWFSVRFIPSLHACTTDGCVPFTGTYRKPPPLPLTRETYLEGGTFALHLVFGERNILNIGSANLIDEGIRGISCNLLLLSIAGRANTPDFLKRVFDCVTPALVAPVHFDNFLVPFEEGLQPQSHGHPDDFAAEMAADYPHIPTCIPDFFERFEL